MKDSTARQNCSQTGERRFGRGRQRGGNPIWGPTTSQREVMEGSGSQGPGCPPGTPDAIGVRSRVKASLAVEGWKLPM